MKRNSNYSSWSGEDLKNLEPQIKAALADYQAKNDRYIASVALGSGHARWAKRNLLPGVNAAKDKLDSLKAQYNNIQEQRGLTQGIEINDATVELVTSGSESQVPWTTIGLAVGALIAIVIIVKLL